MVIFNNNKIFECPYCHQQYNNENEAYECRDYCLDDDVIEKDGDYYFECEYCNKKFDEVNLATECEQKHVENEDKHFEHFNIEKNRALLNEAASHPNQIRLMNFVSNE